MDFINLKAQYAIIENKIKEAIDKVLKSGRFINGPEIKELENVLSEYLNVKHTISLASGTDALLLALMAYDIKEGDEIITTPFTFIATAEVIPLLKAKVVFVDIDEETYNIDVEKIEEKITAKTKAIIPVSLYGQPSDMDEINAIAEKHGIKVIEDAAQSFGAKYKNKKSGALSDIGCTSFYPSKPLGAYGDGGAAFTNDDAIAEKIKMLKDHGQNKRYSHKYIGLNSRLDTIQAAILLTKMNIFEKEVLKREELGKRYTKLLENVSEIKPPKIKEDRTSVYAQYSVRVKEREKVTNALKEKNIPTAIHYPIPLYRQEAYAYLNEDPDNFPVCEKVAEEIMSLPMSPYLSEEEQDTVVAALKEALK